MPLTAVQTLNNDVLPAFEEHDAVIEGVLSDNGREFCGRPDQHPYELFLLLEGIEHKTTKVGRPQSNGILERWHRTLLDEHLRVQGRTVWHETIADMQAALDRYLECYNCASQRPSLYVAEAKRLSWLGLDPAGCLVRWRTRSANVRAPGPSSVARLKIQGPSGSGWSPSISALSAASRSVLALTPRWAAALVRLSQGSTPSSAGR